MTIHVQGIGKIDCRLIQDDERFRDLPEAEQESVAEAIVASERIALSHLWVLGAYEIVRTMSQKARNHATLIDASLTKQLQKLKGIRSVANAFSQNGSSAGTS